MLKRVVLTNFQAHKNLDLEIGKFTTLTGGSNGGKSAVLRAIVALVRNDSASHYIRHGQNSLSVKLFFEDKHQIEWVKGTSINRYVLTLPTGEEKVFDKVGANVPDEVKEVLRLGPIIIGANDKEYINFHQQLEQPFLISSTPGDVAKLFGELTSASQLYSAVGEGNRSMRSIKSQKTTRMGDLRQVKVSLESFDDLVDQERLLQEALNSLKLAEELELKITSLNELKDSHEKLDTRRAEVEELQSGLAPALAVSQETLKHLKDLSTTISNIQATESRLSWLTSSMEAGTRSVMYLKDAVQVDLSPLRKANSRLASLEADAMLIQSASDRIRELTESVQECRQDREEIDRLITGLLESLQDCPSCKQALSQEAKQELLKSGYESYAAH